MRCGSLRLEYRLWCCYHPLSVDQIRDWIKCSRVPNLVQLRYSDVVVVWNLEIGISALVLFSSSVRGQNQRFELWIKCSRVPNLVQHWYSDVDVVWNLETEILFLVLFASSVRDLKKRFELWIKFSCVPNLVQLIYIDVYEVWKFETGISALMLSSPSAYCRKSKGTLQNKPYITSNIYVIPKKRPIKLLILFKCK
ncbi:hypothetical protein AVEN_248727-1 [Araneus ventricosus]|uniref:Uncharacterized protein n=1 Tax=Araneus ventricosus TaxID=182803 RepID=A0A4Y2MMT9_ARAVE|nr:hypothetical protein AVEN_248727-1 [Araneus ventricosus]